jgi:hypothetical protein
VAVKTNLVAVKLSDAELRKLWELAAQCQESVSGVILQLIVNARLNTRQVW